MASRKLLNLMLLVFLAVTPLWNGVAQATAENPTPPPGNPPHIKQGRITNADRQAAAQRLATARAAAVRAGVVSAAAAPGPGAIPDYWNGNFPNYANSQFPASVSIVGDGVNAVATVSVNPDGTPGLVTVVNGGSGYSAAATRVTLIGGGGSGAVLTPTIVITGGVISSIAVSGGTGYNSVPGIRKFVDALPGLTSAGANELGQYIPVASPDQATYPGSDYYQIAEVQYTEQLHSDMPPTLLEGYVQLSPTPTSFPLHYINGSPIMSGGQQVYAVDKPSYLGPFIIAQRDRPVRVKFTNYLPANAGGNLFIPVDTTDMGAGTGPLTATLPSTGLPEFYTQNRATVHLHGGATPWISDGTPDQWTTPAGEVTSYPKGVSVQNVPDMPAPGDGSLTFFYTNQQSARLMFYHDHAYGITRLNVYAGAAAGYLLQDPVEHSLVAAGIVPTDTDQIPLVIQDKTFVPGAAQLAAEDPTWTTTPLTRTWGGAAGWITSTYPISWGGIGSLWFPHVYMTNQNPDDISGANAMGRWDYGFWFFPPFTNIQNGIVTNPYSTTSISGPEPPLIPGTPNPSIVPEGFLDTPVINGTPYPYLNVEPKAYRFRILNAANDRMWNLSLYVAGSSACMWDAATGVLKDATAGEVPMVPASPNPAIPFPADWTTASDGTGIKPDILDGRPMGVPDPRNLGPSWIQIGTEGGFLPSPVVIDPKPIGYQYNTRNIVVGNVTKHSLFLGPAERADVIVDFSQFAGKNLILYNDSPAPVPGFDLRNDYYTGDPDQTSTGGAPTTLPGYGPNTRTVMQIHVAGPTETFLPFVHAALPGFKFASFHYSTPLVGCELCFATN